LAQNDGPPDAAVVDAPQPAISTPVLEFENAWKTAVIADAGVGDGGAVTAQVLATPSPSSSAATDSTPHIVTLGGTVVGSTLQLAVSYEAINGIASTFVVPVGASYYTRIMSTEPKTPSHPLQYSIALALPQNLGQLVAAGLSVQVAVAVQDALAQVSAYVPITVNFQPAGTGVTAAATAGKACTWGLPPTCLPDRTGMIACAVDELSLQVVDCQAGPPAYQCHSGTDGGAAECICPNSCASEGKTCGTDACGHSCGTCAAGYECDPLGNCNTRSKNGCADGTREGFSDAAVFPSIASCEVWWEGGQNLRTPRTGQEWCGNSTGIECNVPADGCAPGWHICMQHGWPADIRDRITSPSGADGGASTVSFSDCADLGGTSWYVAASSSAYTGGGGSCTAFPLGCWTDDVDGYMDTLGCGQTSTANGACNNAIWPKNTRGNGGACGNMSITRTQQNGILCCQDPEITGS
jgi:hypothetical protein